MRCRDMKNHQENIMKVSKLLIIMSIMLSPAVYSSESTPGVSGFNNAEYTWNPSKADTTKRLIRFYQLNDLIEQNYKSNSFATVPKLVEEQLALAEIYKNNWNYGNAIHDGNRVLGLISYQKGDLDTAASYLVEAGKSSGSPQLDSFGPELDLADLLLKKGKISEVTSYLQGVQLYWKRDNGMVAKWVTSIDKGGQPTLDRHSHLRYAQ